MRIGLISDTHGLLREEALAFLWGSDHLIHAGDIGGPDILQQLANIAPLTVVRGNNDVGAWASELKDTQLITLESRSIFVLHDMAQLDQSSLPDGVSVVICGHSHRAVVQQRDGITFINPGSAGPRRFNLAVSVGELIIKINKITPRIISLDVSQQTRRRVRPVATQFSFI